MTSPAPGTLAWFEVATDDSDGAQRFYGSLFGWSFDADGPAASRGWPAGSWPPTTTRPALWS